MTLHLQSFPIADVHYFIMNSLYCSLVPTSCDMNKVLFFSRAILELHQSQGLHDLGAIKWDIALCLLAVYVICYFSLWKGISTSGKVVWFTALFPYAVLLILLVRGITLPGSAEGIKYYLNPNFSAIGSAEVILDKYLCILIV